MKATFPLLLCALAALGCQGMFGNKPSPNTGVEPGAPIAGAPGPAAPVWVVSRPTATAPVTYSLNPAAVAVTVNDRPIAMEDVVTPLLEVHGLRMAEMLVHNALVAQEAARLNVTVTDEEVKAEHDRAEHQIFGEEITPAQRRQLLNDLLLQRGLTRAIWDGTMRRNALLRKMAAPRVTVTEPMLQAEFARQYGEKVQVSHIQLPSVSEAEKIIQMLNDGADFGTLARKYSTNANTAKDNGTLPPFTRDTAAVPKAMRDAAFALQVGQISGIVQVASDFHVLRLDKRFAPADADYEKVKDKLRQDLHASLTDRVQQEILSELRRKAEVKYVDPILRKVAVPPPAPAGP